MDTSNLTLLTDLYELTMMQGYFKTGSQETVVFDAFYRCNPSNGGYAICAGLEQIMDYIKGLHFTERDIAYLRSLGIFEEDFLAYLKDFRFSGDIYAIPEGTVIFPREPLVKVIAPIMEAQLVETAILNILNHQSLIATKAARVCYAAQGDSVMEFGLRRAQGPDAGVYGARAAVIGGCCGTSNVLCGQMFDIPVKGTHAHSWIMSFADEYTAFKTYASLYPSACILLVDTYDTLASGIPNAIRAFNDVLKPQGITKCGIRLDSGDIAYLTKKARKLLDDAGWTDCKITVSNSLDEYLIRDLLHQGAQIDTFGVGERLITSKSEPVFGGVYKLCAVETDSGEIIPKIKISENVAKITNPGFKHVYRFYEKETGKAHADYICLHDETVDDAQDLTIRDPNATWKELTLKGSTFVAQELLVPIFKGGKQVYQSPTLPEIKNYCTRQMDTLWPEVTRFDNPHNYYVDLSDKLLNLRNTMLTEKKHQS